MSPEKGCLASTHREEESSVEKSIKTKSALEVLKVIKELPQDAQVTIAGEITEVPDVGIEPPQIDLSLALKIFVDRVKNN